MAIHATAVIDAQAQIDPSAEIGPYAVIEGPVKVGPGTVLGPHVHLLGLTTIGASCRLHAGVTVGDFPQDRAFTGGDSFCRIGNETVIREYVTIHRGTKPGTETTVGSRCLLMAHSHIGHNCQVADDVILVNGALLGGYVQVGPRALISGNAGVHQFVRVGELAMIGGLAKITRDVPPFLMFDGPGWCVGLNLVGMKRAGLDAAERADVKEAYRRLYRSPGTWAEGIEALTPALKTGAGQRLLAFLREPSKRGIHAKRPPKAVLERDFG